MINLQLTISSIPKVVLRKRQGLILVQNKSGQYVLGKKDVYPQDVARLVGGGIETDENPHLGTTRELNEELAVDASPEDITFLEEVQVHLDCPSENQKIEFTIFLFHHQLETDQVEPNDDLDGLAVYSRKQYFHNIDLLNQLSPEIIPPFDFAWADWGKLYAQIHQTALDLSDQLHVADPN